MVELNIKKSMIFIDARNLLGGWNTYCKDKGFTKANPTTQKLEITKKIDYDKLVKEVSRDTDFIRGYFLIQLKNRLTEKYKVFMTS